MENRAAGRRGKVRGIGEVRGKDGKLKGHIVLEGETDLSEEELRDRLDLPQDQTETERKDEENS